MRSETLLCWLVLEVSPASTSQVKGWSGRIWGDLRTIPQLVQGVLAACLLACLPVSLCQGSAEIAIMQENSKETTHLNNLAGFDASFIKCGMAF